MTAAIHYDAPPTLASFLDSDTFVRIVEGPLGSGKSSACVLEILRRAVEQQRGPDGVRRTRWAVVRNTYRELEDTTRKTFEQWVPSRLGKWQEADFIFRMRFADVDAEVLFRALDRPGDIKKLLSLELTGAYFNEAREIPKAAFDAAQGRVGRYPSQKDGGPTWFGLWADSNPWHTNHWLAKLRKARLKDFAFFQQPGGRSPHAENVANLPPGYYQRLCAGKDAEWIRVYIDGEEASSDVGSIYGKWLDALEKRGGVCAFEHPNTDVFTTWDLGRGDATAIWFWRLNSHGVADVIDFYAAHGKGLSHFFGVVDGKPYRYAKHVLPHDARALTLATQQSTYEQACAHWGMGNVLIAPKLSVEDGISAARWCLEQPMRIHSRCDEPTRNADGGEEYPSGLECLREYRYEWDSDAACFRQTPLHNFASDPADSFRYHAVFVRYAHAMRPQPTAPLPPMRGAESLTMDEAWASAPRHRRQRA